MNKLQINILGNAKESADISFQIKEVASAILGPTDGNHNTSSAGWYPHDHLVHYNYRTTVNSDKCWQILQETNTALNEINEQVISRFIYLEEKVNQSRIAVVRDVEELKQAMFQVIALCQQQGRFIQQLTAMLDATESLMKQQEELATQSEAQYLAVKRKLEELNKKQQKEDEL